MVMFSLLSLIHSGIVNENENTKNVLSQQKFYFVPVINIDALNAIEDSHNVNPDFTVLALEKRKNMVQLASQSNCENKEGQEIGVDLNRNWGVDF